MNGGNKNKLIGVGKMRQATKQDYKVGQILFDSEGNKHQIDSKYSKGIWNCKRGNVIFENEAKFYKVQQ